MAELLTADQMRALESAAIESGDVSGLQLMERAGEGVVAAVFAHWPELGEGAHHAVVLCGPGNNGGDGFVIARLLKARGWKVEAFLLGEAADLPPDARANYQRWRVLGKVAPLEGAVDALQGGHPLVVDAIFGTGLTRAVPEIVHDTLVAASVHRCVAVDLPSLLSSDTGRAVTPWVQAVAPADLTVSFHALKLGHVLADGPALCSRAVVADIGLGAGPQNLDVVMQVERPARDWMQKPAGHKYDHGQALVVSGGAGQTGAARLAARSALRVGAGLVTLGVQDPAQAEVAAQSTAVMIRPVNGGPQLSGALEDLRINAVCIGPGLGVMRGGNLVPIILEAERATVLDADALSSFADAPETLFEALHWNCVLTPHDGEFARLFPDLANLLGRDMQYSRVDAVRAAADRAGCTVLLKGPDTVIADPGGACAVHSAAYDRAVPWLATAGAGDVLAGFVTGLLARGWAPFNAATGAAWLHVECARRFGPGLIAEDLPEMLPQVLREIIA